MAKKRILTLEDIQSRDTGNNTLANRIQIALAEKPYTDTGLEVLLNKRHQHINQECRRLEAEGKLIREEVGGIIVNFSKEQKKRYDKAQSQPQETIVVE